MTIPWRTSKATVTVTAIATKLTLNLTDHQMLLHGWEMQLREWIANRLWSKGFYCHRIIFIWSLKDGDGLPSNYDNPHGHLSHCHQNYDNPHNTTWNINLEYWSIIFIIIITTILIIGQWDKHHPQAEPGKNGAEGKVGAGFLTFLSIFLSSFIIIIVRSYEIHIMNIIKKYFQSNSL